MSRDRYVLLLAGLAVVVALTTSTGGVSSMTSERGFHADVVEDSSAYLGFEQTPNGTENATTELDVEITNRLPAGTRLRTIHVGVDDTKVDLAVDDPVGPGESVSHKFESVPCDGTVVVVASGDGVRISLERPIECG